jgi:hypothetical protein
METITVHRDLCVSVESDILDGPKYSNLFDIFRKLKQKQKRIRYLVLFPQLL